MTKREAIELTHTYDRLQAIGITRDDCDRLRRISMTLRKWFEYECGTGDGNVSVSIERDGPNGDGKPFRRVQYPSAHGYVDRRYPIADKETGARKRLAAIMAQYPTLTAFIQSDPRGCALYILRPQDLTGDKGPLPIESAYTRGIAIG